MYLVCFQRWLCTLKGFPTNLLPLTCSALGTWRAQCLVHKRQSANARVCLLCLCPRPLTLPYQGPERTLLGPEDRPLPAMRRRRGRGKEGEEEGVTNTYTSTHYVPGSCPYLTYLTH